MIQPILDQLEPHVQAGVVSLVLHGGEQVLHRIGSRLEAIGLAHQAATVFAMNDWNDDEPDEQEDDESEPETFGQYL